MRSPRRWSLALLVVGLTFAVVGVTPASANHSTPPDNRDYYESYQHTYGRWADTWEIGYTSLNACYLLIENTSGVQRLYTPRVTRDDGTLLDQGPSMSISPGDFDAWIIEPGPAWSQSLKPKIRINVQHLGAGGTWVFDALVDQGPYHDLAGEIYSIDPLGSNNRPGC